MNSSVAHGGLDFSSAAKALAERDAR